MQEPRQGPNQTDPANGQLETADLELVSGGITNKLDDQSSAIDEQKKEAAERSEAAMNAATQEMMTGISAGIVATGSASSGFGTKRKGK